MANIGRFSWINAINAGGIQYQPLYLRMFLLAMLIKTEREHSNSLQIYICFWRRSIDINYINVSVRVYDKSPVVLLNTHISP